MVLVFLMHSLWILWRALSGQKGKFHLNYMCICVANAFKEEEWSLNPFTQIHFAEVASWVSITVRLVARVKHLPADHSLLSLISVFLVISSFFWVSSS